MSKVICATTSEVSESPKLVLIKHTKVMKNANGNNVTVVDYEEIKNVDEAIAGAEAEKASLEASLAQVESDLVEYKAIKDAE